MLFKNRNYDKQTETDSYYDDYDSLSDDDSYSYDNDDPSLSDDPFDDFDYASNTRTQTNKPANVLKKATDGKGIGSQLYRDEARKRFLKRLLAIAGGALLALILFLLLFSDKEKSPSYVVAPIPAVDTIPSDDVAILPVVLPEEEERDEWHYLYYRSLLTAEERAVYDVLLNGIADRKETLRFPIKDISRLSTISEYLSYDRPDLFWWLSAYNSTYTEQNGKYEVELMPEYRRNEQEIAMLAPEIDRLCADLVAEQAYSTDYEKVKSVHDFLIDRTVYDYAYLETDVATFMTEKHGVCEGYAKMFKILMDKLGVPSIYVHGVSDDGELHAWNLVSVDENWYQIDVTWDDPINDDGTQTLTYNYFCLKDEEMNRTHICENAELLPACFSDQANYFVRRDRVLYDYDLDILSNWFSYDYPAEGAVYFKCASVDVYNEALHNLFEREQVWDIADEYFGSTNQRMYYNYWNKDDVYTIRIVITVR